MPASTQISFMKLFSLIFFRLLSGSDSATFTITNKCRYTVWPGMLSGTGSSAPIFTGFALPPGESNTFPVPPAWSGRLWGRTLCSHDITGKFSCITADCGSSTIECAAGNAAPPVTLAEFTLNGNGGLDFFDVSLVNGFNLPVRVEPRGGTGAGNCRATGCEVDLNAACPAELEVIRDGEVVACKSVCQAESSSCNSSLPTSRFFKSACPHAHVYAHDGGFFTCVSADYIITFCPTSWIKPGGKKNPAVDDNTGGHMSDSSPINVIAVVVILASVCGLFVVCQITVRLENGDCVFRMGAGTRAETIDPNTNVTSA